MTIGEGRTHGLRADLRRDPSPPARKRTLSLAWASDAACRGKDPDWFYPKRGGNDRDVYARARQICKRCPVRFACLEEALEQEMGGHRYGMFGGLTPDQRDNLGKLRKLARS